MRSVGKLRIFFGYFSFLLKNVFHFNLVFYKKIPIILHLSIFVCLSCGMQDKDICLVMFHVCQTGGLVHGLLVLFGSLVLAHVIMIDFYFPAPSCADWSHFSRPLCVQNKEVILIRAAFPGTGRMKWRSAASSASLISWLFLGASIHHSGSMSSLI